MTQDKQVAVKENSAVTAWDQYEGDADGFEEMDRSEIAIPFINLLQSNSELVEDGKASAGQLYNNVMETLHDEMTIIPCKRQRLFVEWVPVDDGGGLVGVHDPSSDYVQSAIAANGGSTIKLKVSNGKGGENDLVETIQLYVLVVDEDGNYERAVVAFSSTKLKPYRQFISKANMQTHRRPDGRKVRLPLWAHRWKLASKPDVSKAGKKFHNLELTWDGGSAKAALMGSDDELVAAASEFHDLVAGGLASADMSTVDKSEEEDKTPF